MENHSNHSQMNMTGMDYGMDHEKMNMTGMRHGLDHGMGHAMNHGMGHGMGHGLSMGCGNLSADSVKAFINKNAQMHEDMAVDLSCDHTVDFVRAMIPHHRGAVDMCKIYKDYGGNDAFLNELCLNITTTQSSEIAFLETYLS